MSTDRQAQNREHKTKSPVFPCGNKEGGKNTKHERRERDDVKKDAKYERAEGFHAD